jgi:hypothetical protein
MAQYKEYVKDANEMVLKEEKGLYILKVSRFFINQTFDAII